MRKNLTLTTVLSLGTVGLALSGSNAIGQTKVAVPTNIDRGVIAAPTCPFPCDKDFILPSFARKLSLAGDTGTFETILGRSAFFERLENWREHAEIYRRSIERKQFLAPDWRKANVTYHVELGNYHQFFESYRNAISMDRGGRITYNK